jgi:hypothetical protein
MGYTYHCEKSTGGVITRSTGDLNVPPPTSQCPIEGCQPGYECLYKPGTRGQSCQKVPNVKIATPDVSILPSPPSECKLGSKNECGLGHSCQRVEFQSCGIVGPCKGVCQKNPDGKLIPRSTSDVNVPPADCGIAGSPGCRDGYTCRLHPTIPEGKFGGSCIKSTVRQVYQRSTSDLSNSAAICKEKCAVGFECVNDNRGAQCPPKGVCGKCVKRSEPSLQGKF